MFCFVDVLCGFNLQEEVGRKIVKNQLIKLIGLINELNGRKLMF